MPQLPRSTYYDPRTSAQSAALIRARRPYLVKNAITGTAIFAFAVSVYAYTIRAVAQDDFEDVEMPPPPVQPYKPSEMVNKIDPVVRAGNAIGGDGSVGGRR